MTVEVSAEAEAARHTGPEMRRRIGVEAGAGVETGPWVGEGCATSKRTYGVPAAGGKTSSLNKTFV